LNRKTAVAVSLAALALVGAGCGDDDGGDEAEETTVSSEQALAEIPPVEQGLQQGLAAYRAGDAERADQLVGDAYLEHFELVEPPLEEADPELNEELEELISTEIREQIKAGAPANEIAGLVAEAQKELDQAVQALGG
jgi:hypothetical protein